MNSTMFFILTCLIDLHSRSVANKLQRTVMLQTFQTKANYSHNKSKYQQKLSKLKRISTTYNEINNYIMKDLSSHDKVAYLKWVVSSGHEEPLLKKSFYGILDSQHVQCISNQSPGVNI